MYTMYTIMYMFMYYVLCIMFYVLCICIMYMYVYYYTIYTIMYSICVHSYLWCDILLQIVFLLYSAYANPISTLWCVYNYTYDTPDIRECLYVNMTIW